MKEITAYIRPELIDQVVDALEKAGARDLTVIRVDAFGPLADAGTDAHHMMRKYAERYSAVARLDLVCRDGNAERFAEVIRANAHTGQHGDGRIFITEVQKAINIRTAETGEAGL